MSNTGRRDGDDDDDDLEPTGEIDTADLPLSQTIEPLPPMHADGDFTRDFSFVGRLCLRWRQRKPRMVARQ